jgi:multidrug transporter EmrE-like cation transporter
MMAGMGRLFSYDTAGMGNRSMYQQDLKMVYRDDRRFYTKAEIGIESNGSDGEIVVANTRWSIQTEWRLGSNRSKGYEIETHLGRYLGANQWWMPYIGFDWRIGHENDGGKPGKPEKNLFGQENTKNKRTVICMGVQYTLPMLLKADTRIDTEGKLRLQLGREDLALTSRLRLNFYVNSDKEYMTGFKYMVTKYFSLSTHYDSDMGLGAGITINYRINTFHRFYQGLALQGFFISNHINRCGDSVTASAVCGNSFGIKSGEMKAADIVLLIALAAIWGSSYVFLRMVTPVMGVTHTLATRVILAAIVMTLIFRSRNKFNGFKTYRRHYLVLGIFNILLPFSLITYSVSHLTTSLSAMLNATTPIFTMVISSVWLKERMNVTKLASIFVALSGLAVLLGWMPVELSGKGIISILLSLLAAVSYGIGAVYT